MADSVIETHELRKSFKGQPALTGLNLKVPAGSIFGFLGRNGAGKTTTIKTLMGLLWPDSGEARVFGLIPGDSSSGVEVGKDRLVGNATTEQLARLIARGQAA